ncbi:MAG: zinc-dependent metalloprotease family protein [Planctomycetota bacterium]
MKCFENRHAKVLIALAAALGTHAIAAHAQEISLYDVDRLLSKAEGGETITLHGPSRNFEVRVEEHSLRAPGFRVSARSRFGSRDVIAPRTTTFRGVVVGEEEDSVVRLSFGRRGLFGYVQSGEDEIYIEPLDVQALGSTSSYHKTTDSIDLNPNGTCAASVDLTHHSDHDHQSSHVVGESTANAENIRVMQIAIHADFEYFDTHGTDTTASIEEILNVVDGIFRADLGLALEVTFMEFYEEDTDPYTSSDALTLLNEMQSHWNQERGDVERDVVHLFTGRELDGTTVGIAFVAEVCDLGGAYGLSQDLTSSAMMPVLVAHEIGHNLGAFHDSSSDDPKFIMNPVLSLSTVQQFSDTSQSDINDYMDGVNCLPFQSVEEESDPEDPPPADESDDGGDVPVDTPDDDIVPSGGDGGGPVDPILLLILGAAGLATRRRKRVS